MTVRTFLSIVVIWLLSCSMAVAGSSREQAAADVAVARAIVEVANSRPQLKDSLTTKMAAADGSAVSPPSALEPANGSGLSQFPAFDKAVQTVAESAQQELNKSGATVPYSTNEPIRLIIQQPVKAWTAAPYTTTTIVAGWCEACRWQKINNGAGNAQVQHIYIDESEVSDPEMRDVWKKNNGQIPITFWRNARGTLIYIVGRVDTATILKKIKRNDPPTQEQLSASVAGPAGSISGKAQINKVIDWFRSNIGEGVICRFRWDRTGANTFPLLAKADWSCEAIFGRYGHFELSAKDSRLPIDAIGFGYKVTGPDVAIDLDSVSIQGLAAQLGVDQLSGPKPIAHGSQAPPQIGVLSVLSIISIIHNVFSILNPSVDLAIGGNVEAQAVLNGDVIEIKFSQCPRVKIKMLFSFDLGVERVDISESQVRVFFTGSRWIRERTFAVQ